MNKLQLKLASQYRLKMLEIEVLKRNYGVKLWVEWQETFTGKSEPGLDYADGVNQQLENLCPLLIREGLDLTKLVTVFNGQSESKLGTKGGKNLYYLSGSPCLVSPESIFNLIADLYARKMLHLIGR